MSEFNEVKVVKIAPAGGAIYKGTLNTGRPGFILDTVITLEDGRTFKHHITSERKKNVPESLQRAEASIAAGAMSASFHDGEYFGTVQRYTIGAAGLVHSAA